MLFFMKKLFFLLLPMMAAIWLTTLGGCRKCKGIEGKVLEFGTETPISNATVSLSNCEGGLGDPLVCSEVASTLTDSRGRFNFKADGFSVAAKAPDYWDTGDDFEMVVNECPKPVLYLYPFANLELTFKNISGAYGVSHSNNVYQVPKGEELVFHENLKGNLSNRVVFSIFSTENISIPFPDSLFATFNDKNLLIDAGEFGNTIDFTLIGHSLNKITINF
jgi:hypothetical protein